MAHKTGAAYSGGHIVHGCANAMYLPKVIRFNAVEPEAQKRYANIARFLHLEGSTDAELVDALIAHIKGMNAQLNIPTCIKDYEGGIIDEKEFMEKLPGALKPGGRVAILTFHSGEDKLVKRALKEGFRDGIYSEYAKDVVRPSAQECAQNARAHSTKMRWAVRA